MEFIKNLTIYTMLIFLSSCLKAGMDPTLDFMTPPGPTFYVNIESIENVRFDNKSTYGTGGYCTDEGAIVTAIITDGSNSFTQIDACTGNFWSVNFGDVSTLLNGSTNLSVDLDDANSQHYATTYSIIKDVIVPNADLTAPSNINISNMNSFTLGGNCNDPDAHLEININEIYNYVNCNGATWSFSGSVTGLSDGVSNITIQVKIDDPAGNSKSLTSVSVSKDTVAPTFSFSQQPTDTKISALNSSFELTCSDYDGNGLIINTYNTSNSLIFGPNGYTCDTASSRGSFSVIPDGDYYFVVDLTDNAGNIATVTSNLFNNDQFAPTTASTINFDSGMFLNNLYRDDFILSGTCEINGGDIFLSFTTGLTGGSVIGPGFYATTCDAGTYSISVDIDDPTPIALIYTPWGTSFQSYEGIAYAMITHRDIANNYREDFFAFKKDTIDPIAATGLTWSDLHFKKLMTHPRWMHSTSVGIDYISQDLKVYSGSGGCSSGTLVHTKSALMTDKKNSYFEGLSGTQYSFEVISYDIAGNLSKSTCSSTQTISLPGSYSSGDGINTGFDTDGIKEVGFSSTHEELKDLKVDLLTSEVYAVGYYGTQGYITKYDSSGVIPGIFGYTNQSSISYSNMEFNALTFDENGDLLVAGADTNVGRTSSTMHTYLYDSSNGTNIEGHSYHNSSDNTYANSIAFLDKPSGGDFGLEDNEIFAAGFKYGADAYIMSVQKLSSMSYGMGFNGGVTAHNSSEINITYNEEIFSNIVLRDHSHIICGTVGADAFIARKHISGAFDTSFNSTGFVVINDNTGGADICNSVVTEGDGTILVGGSFGLKKYLLSDGSLDTNFNTTGELSVSYEVKDIVVQGDRKILTVGTYLAGTSDDMIVSRFTSSGGVDTTFNFGGTSGYIKIDPSVGLDDRGNAIDVDVQTGDIYLGGGCGTSGAGNFDFCMLKLN